MSTSSATNPTGQPVTRFRQLSALRQALVRLFQSINFGRVEDLEVRRGEPVFSPPPLVLLDLKLDAEEGPRHEQGLSDFVLCDEVRRLASRLDEIENGCIQRIEVRAGIPRRLVVEARALEVRQ
jgi:hypothetical protein